MTADVVNLRIARKRQGRQVKDEAAAANRAAHGIPKAMRSAAAMERRREGALLDAHSRQAGDADHPAPAPLDDA